MSLLLLLLLFFLISINGFSLVPAFYQDPSTTMRFELIHRHAPELSGKTLGSPKTWLERVNELAHSDKLRIQMISQRVDQRRRTAEVPGQSSFGIPMNSGSYAGTGQYFVSFRVGTPAQKFLLVADTGSDLTWMNCNFPCHRCPRRVRRRRIFHPERSFSFKTIPCASQMCRFDLQNLFSLTLCPTPVAPCAYDFGYKDGSSAQGFFANESVTVGLMNGRKMKLHNMLLGCSKTFQGGSFRTADGVLGLGFSKYSFAVRATQSFGGKFSYCLVDHLSPRNISNYLTFGNSHAALPDMQYTQLFTGVIDSFYGVNVGGISVGGVMLRIPMYIWDVFGQGGMIVDSGSTLTYLPELAFRPLMDALKLPLLRLEKVKIDIFEFCFNSTTGFDEAMVPRLAIHFADGARLEPPVKSYVIKVADGVRCLGFQTIQWPATSILGSIMQQNHLWEFDLLRNRLGFVPSTCVHS